MKKVLFTVVIVACSVIAQAQTIFDNLRLDLALGYAIPAQSEMNGGVIFGLEPKYILNDKISLGLRLEAAMRSTTIETDAYIITTDAKAMGSVFATGDYYFKIKKIMPFIGLGFGLVRIPSLKFNPDNVVIDGNNIIVKDMDYTYSMNAAYMPRLGVERGRVRVALEYNMMGKTESTTAGLTSKIDNNYIGIKLAFFLGGKNNSRFSSGNRGSIPIK